MGAKIYAVNKPIQPPHARPAYAFSTKTRSSLERYTHVYVGA